MLMPLTIFAQDTAPNEKHLFVFDVLDYFDRNSKRTASWQYDVLTLLASLQGLVNRPEPGGGVPDHLLYLIYIRDGVISWHQKDIDRYWLERLRSPGQLLADYRIIEVTDLESLLLDTEIRDHYQKVVLWDERVPSTANVAATMCGVDSLLPVRYDPTPGSLFSDIVAGGPKIMVGGRLVDNFMGYGTIPQTDRESTRSRKGDAYLWAKIQYLDSLRGDPSELAYYLDGFDWDPNQPGFQCPDLINACLLNHDFFISRKGFFFDLSPWWDERATDETSLLRSIAAEEIRDLPEGVDLDVLKEILKSAEVNTRGERKMIRIGGYIPWWLKYTNHASVGGKHTPEETQNEFIAVASCFNAYLEPDAYGMGGVANTSVFQHVRLQEPFLQNAIPKPRNLEKKVYLLFYMGDFESASWLAQSVPTLWDDACRGSVPLAWGINPTLSDRLPQVFNYLYFTRTGNDFFVGSRSGAGLINPGFLLEGNRPHSGLPGGLDIWVAHNRVLYRQFDIQITGLVDNGNAGEISKPLQEAFFDFSPHGVGAAGPFFEPLSLRLIPFLQYTDHLSHRMEEPIGNMIQTIRDHDPGEKPAFQIYRCTLTTPTIIYLLAKELERLFPNQYEIVDPYTFFFLLRENLGGSNESIAQYIDHNVPQRLSVGQTFQATVRLRNDGWDTWNPKGTPPQQSYRLCYKWLYHAPGGEIAELPGRHNVYLPENVLTGKYVDVNLLIETPPYPMIYQLRFYLDREGIGPSLNWRDINVMVTDEQPQ
ncbi:MAG TPA: GxGYxYP family putative glycoside hydrolase [bacterium]|nr:GxGYxYP family putative glycoside hydrolase [bacterium]